MTAEEPVGSMVHLETLVVSRLDRVVVAKGVVKVLVLMGQNVLFVLVLMLSVHGNAVEEVHVTGDKVVQVVGEVMAGDNPASDLYFSGCRV